MKATTLLAALAVAVGTVPLGTGCVVHETVVADDEGPVVVRAPPPEQAEDSGAAPGTEYLWIRGHWAWNGADWVWHHGHWEVRRAGFEWIPGHWVRRHGGWLWIEGHWRRL